MGEVYVRIPHSDVEKRRLFGFILGITRKEANRLTCEEMEKMAIERKLIGVVADG